MSDDVVQLAGDACALTARRVLEQCVDDDLLGGSVFQGLAARPPRDPSQGGHRDQ